MNKVVEQIRIVNLDLSGIVWLDDFKVLIPVTDDDYDVLVEWRRDDGVIQLMAVYAEEEDIPDYYRNHDCQLPDTEAKQLLTYLEDQWNEA